MTLLPAPPNTGILFRRVDLDSRAEIPAQVEHVSETARSTTLSRGKAKVQTVEHVLASLSGLGVTNAIVEVDANDVQLAVSDGNVSPLFPLALALRWDLVVQVQPLSDG